MFGTLEARVKSAKEYTHDGILSHHLISELQIDDKVVNFTLPVYIALKPDDRLEFYDGKITEEPNLQIRHADYLYLRIYRGEEVIAHLDARDMLTLSDVQFRY